MNSKGDQLDHANQMPSTLEASIYNLTETIASLQTSLQDVTKGNTYIQFIF